jgi:hypothetical protein
MNIMKKKERKNG